MKRPEILAPAGSLSKLKFAFTYGADAVYVGGEAFSLREAAENFSLDELREGIEYAHARGKKVYITANILPHNKDLEDFKVYIRQVADMGADAAIISDLGLFDLARTIAPELDIHISTQANNVNYASANAWYKMGAKRIIVARELSIEEIKEIRANVPKDLELECFVHGAMCISYSGRCLLSNYMTGRDSNQGACAHPCRWKYYLMEEQRPGEYMPVFENERGTFIYNSKDLCMIRHLKELAEAGVSSLKIEGRVKTEYYVATVTKAYKDALNDAVNGVPFNENHYKELEKISHREYTTGFFFGKPDGNQQIYTSSSYKRLYDLVGIVEDYNAEDKMLHVQQRNKFAVGDTLEILRPEGEALTFTVETMYNEKGEEIENCPHAMMKIKIPCPYAYPKDSILRKEK
ncbi:MAG: U32 family peptidase C-terminal domain-containing protein [Clostridia bacterium]|nr:U32 family peptidase C-terminal domain-containing protein [Clostridia bacterium]